MELYKQISDANRIKYGTEAEKILRIIINQYSDRTHFIYEILQNAEDAGATRIQFHLEKEKLVIKHDGRPFNEKDIEGVCGIANGTKEDGTRIGHFGIGFKSVYCYTEHPYIYSGEYHFVIQNQLFPKEVPGSQEIAYDEKNEAQMEAKKNKIKSAKELIEQGDRKQRESGKDDMELEISPISEKGKLKREQNLDRQLADSMDNFISVARGLSFSSRPSNKEERIFLEQEYDGHCQICLKQIRKYNGEHYFEAINIIKFSKLPERLANSGKYGWNSLCLCPNCAAEYNYCSKKIWISKSSKFRTVVSQYYFT